MDTTLAARFELEVLDRIGDIGAGAVDTGLRQRPVEQLAGRADKGAAGQILLIAGLFADEHQRRIDRSLAKDGLRRGFVERAAGAAGGFLAQRLPRHLAVAAHLLPCGVDHARLPCLCAGDQLRDQRGFRHVLPVFARHLLQHRADLHAGGIEDAGIIGLPHLLGRVAIGGVGLAGGGALAERFAVPVQRHLRRQDRPAHRGETVDEKGGVGADDMMVGFEPGDEARRAVLVHLAEADEGAHLVNVAPHVLGERFQSANQRIGLILQQFGLGAQPGQRGVEQRPALRIGGQRGAARKVHERAGHREAGVWRRRGVCHRLTREQVGGGGADLPDDVLWRYAVCGQAARGVTPTVEIIGLGEGDDAHRSAGRPDGHPVDHSRSSPPGGFALASSSSLGLRSS